MKRGLYLVTPDWDDTAHLLAVSRAAIEGGACVLQYRHKTASPVLRLEQARALRALTQAFSCSFIVNDDFELALAVGADGLHIGRDDGALPEIRATAPDLAVGVSCYDDFELARLAHMAGAAYVAFGAMYPSPTKPHAVAAPHALISRARHELGAHVTCIGGITASNVAPLIEAGADWVAVITDIYQAADPRVQAAKFAALYK
ncbi:MAG: thiamine phosphate synthase [Candidatus Dactylopiibacterium carminicum]|nr:MAG: thiamine phosphate synthase [Candidatus Dactylopiibacterium carminicum]